MKEDGIKILLIGGACNCFDSRYSGVVESRLFIGGGGGEREADYWLVDADEL